MSAVCLRCTYRCDSPSDSIHLEPVCIRISCPSYPARLNQVGLEGDEQIRSDHRDVVDQGCGVEVIVNSDAVDDVDNTSGVGVVGANPGSPPSEIIYAVTGNWYFLCG